MRSKKWSHANLALAVKTSSSIRQVLQKLGLREAGGNYNQIKKYIKKLDLDDSHFTGRGWSKGKKIPFRPKIPLDIILVEDSNYQTSKLKKRLFRAGLKQPACEECGWKKISIDGRLPLELDHINGNSRDHRIHNLRILCPNCHSLKPTHRGANRK